MPVDDPVLAGVVRADPSIAVRVHLLSLARILVLHDTAPLGQVFQPLGREDATVLLLLLSLSSEAAK